MIIEWILNLLVGLLKAPVSLLNIPDVDVTSFVSALMPYVESSYSFVRFFLDNVAFTIIGISLTCMALFKAVDIISTIVGFFKKTGWYYEKTGTHKYSWISVSYGSKARRCSAWLLIPLYQTRFGQCGITWGNHSQWEFKAV